jgi:CO/xanthine dehydrogenase Mo-binding subunit
MPVPATVQLKNPSQFRLIGQKVARLDSRPKCDGSLKFGLDLDLPGMRIAVVAHPPVFGARVKSFDDAVNPLTIESQFQAGLAFGASQLMANGAITFKDGRVEQRNFDGFTPPYIYDAPVAVEVHIVPSTDTPTGCGEPPVPVISPAVVNALTKLTGKRYRSLPLVDL